VVALVSRGRTIGAVLVASLTEDLADRRLLGEVTGRAAVALDNATLYGAERRFGRALQQLLLPTELPPLPGVRAAARYLAGTAGRDVGGDFFIGHAFPDGRALLAIGDVVGHGIEAAARMGQLRAVVAAYAFEGDGVERLLTRVAARSLDLLDVEMATMLVAVHDPARHRLTIASAGHPPPLIAAPGAPAALVELEPGPPLGFGAAAYGSTTVEVPPGSTVVLYTDGLVENRGETIDDGLERLRDALDDLRMPPEQVCDHILAKLGREGGGRDDIALVVFGEAAD
jgi:serine phosphatase RsbU (regulator of sigma subunit)